MAFPKNLPNSDPFYEVYVNCADQGLILIFFEIKRRSRGSML
jgi:hypothetical protein